MYYTVHVQNVELRVQIAREPTVEEAEALQAHIRAMAKLLGTGTPCVRFGVQ